VCVIGHLERTKLLGRTRLVIINAYLSSSASHVRFRGIADELAEAVHVADAPKADVKVCKTAATQGLPEPSARDRGRR
jgi:hypothetical protein